MTKYNIDVLSLEKIRTKKLTFKGVTKDYDVYRVPIDMLFYNDLNGRIATFISQYQANGDDITKLENKEYNDKIAEFIKESSTAQRYKITKEDIKANTQKEVGVVLTDGRVIDGNRRFTCLRELFAETGDQKYGYFEAVVLDAPKDEDEAGWKAIGSLELELQIGTDEKVDYSPIDWLVRVYRDVVKHNTYTEQEYCRLTKLTPSQFRTTKTKAELMEDFLEFFDRPEQFFIAKKLELDGPLQELVKLRRKCSDREWDMMKSVFYVYLWTAKKGDKTREIRRALKLVDTKEFDDLIVECDDLAEKIISGQTDIVFDFSKATHVDSQPQNNQANQTYSSEQQPSHQTIQDKIADAIQNKSVQDAKLKPIKCCENALLQLSAVDIDLVNHWKEADLKTNFNKLLDDIIKKVVDLKGHVN